MKFQDALIVFFPLRHYLIPACLLPLTLICVPSYSILCFRPLTLVFFVPFSLSSWFPFLLTLTRGKHIDGALTMQPPSGDGLAKRGLSAIGETIAYAGKHTVHVSNI